MHLHFDSDEEEGRHRMDASAAAAPSCPPAAPSPAASGLRLPRCLCSVRVDFNDLSDPCYVFKVVRSADASVFAASVSNNRIKLYGMQASNLTHIGDLTGHGGTITDVAFPLVDAPHALFSASRDGTVRGWDTRAGRQAEAFSAGNQELFSFAVAEHVLAAGGQGNILFYDRRAGGKQLACFDDTHMDDVTQLRFHAASRQLISGSQDGLLAVHSLAGGINDEEGFAAALNVGTSVEEIGLYGPQDEKMWVRTGTESLHLWEWLKGTREDVEGGDGAFADLAAAREQAGTAACSVAAVAPYFSNGVDYLVGCHYEPASQALLLVAGTSDGAAGFFPLAEQQAAAGQLPPGASIIGAPAMVLAGGHESVVRSTLILEAAASSGGPICVSGGEDAKLCVWGMAGPGAPSASATMSSGSSGGRMGRGKVFLKRSTPY